jgi:hypothetical protein
LVGRQHRADARGDIVGGGRQLAPPLLHTPLERVTRANRHAVAEADPIDGRGHDVVA